MLQTDEQQQQKINNYKEKIKIKITKSKEAEQNDIGICLMIIYFDHSLWSLWAVLMTCLMMKNIVLVSYHGFTSFISFVYYYYCVCLATGRGCFVEHIQRNT